VLHPIGRALQLFGLILLPAALLYGMTSDDKRAVGIELACLALGGAAFLVGTRMLRAR
jgi:hypothetical protein